MSTKNSSIFFLVLASLALSSCVPEKSEILVRMKKNNLNTQQATISSVQIVNSQLIINGNGFSDITNVKVDGTSFNELFSIESKSATKIIANSVRAFSFDVSKVFNVIISDAQGSATFPIDFSLCNATLNTKSFDCTAPIADKDVLSYDAVSGKWKPRAVSGLNYLGAFNASSNPATGPAIQPAGAYYIISASGAIAGIPFTTGDWLVSNGSSWQKIDNSTAVISVFGRNGVITAQTGDYNLDMLGDISFPTAPVAGKVLKFDGTHWVAGDDVSGGGAGSVTATEIADGAVTDVKIDTVSASKISGSITSAQITDGAIVNADINAAAAIDYSKLNVPNGAIPYAKLNIANGDISYAKLNIADGDIPAAKISGLPILSSILAASITDGDTAHAPTGEAVYEALQTKIGTSGGTLSVGTISGVPTPVGPSDIVNKAYVDSAIAGVDGFTEAAVLGTDLAGLNTGVNGPITAADSVLGAFGKMQYQVTDLKAKGQWDKTVNDISYSAGNVSIDKKLRLKSDNANYVEILSPNSLAATYTLTLPANDGNANQVLKTDGAGVLAWVDVNDANVQSFAKSALPTCAAGEVLKSNGTIFSCITDNTGAGAFSGTADRAVITNAGGTLAISATTSTELGYVSGVTSSIQTQLNAKQATGNYVTALTGDVTASGPGAVAATVTAVGGVTAANVAAGANLANAATNSNTANTIVKRDASGNFTATNVTGTVAVANGGTGATTAVGARTNLGLGTAAVVNTGSSINQLPLLGANATVGSMCTFDLTLGFICNTAIPTGDASTANPLSQFAATTSAQLAGVLSNETGTGLAVFNTAPTFLTNLTAPLIIGGTGTSSSLTYKTTSGVGAVGADHIFQVGNNGATEAMRITNDGNVGIGTSIPDLKLVVNDVSAGNLTFPIIVSNGAVTTVGTAAAIGFRPQENGIQGYSVKGAIAYEYKSSWGRGDMHILQNSTANSSKATLADAAVTIQNAGNVGIGTITPGSKLDVKGGVRISGSTSGYVGFAVPAAAGSTTYTWPSAAPASNRILQSDNTGTLSWVSPGGVGDALVANPLSQFAATTSAQLAGVLSDESGTGAAIFAGSPTFTGVPLAPTAAVNTNTTQLATTAFVVGQASSLGPVMNGVQTVGTSLKYSREDHIHPIDTSRAPAAGSASITTLGTITAGVWNGTTIALANGGTGATTAAGARTNLGLGTAAVANTGSSINQLPLLGANATVGSMCTFDLTLGFICNTAIPTGNASTANPLSQFAATTSAQLAGVLSNETGTGLAVFNTAPTFLTNLTAPLIIGGTTTTSSLTYKTTSGVGAAGADHIFQVGNNGATEAMRILNNGNVGIGTNSPSSLLDMNGALTVRGISAPTVSPAGQGRIYYDSTANKFKSSVNGGAYSNLGEATPGGFNRNVQFNDMGVMAGASSLFWDSAQEFLGIGAPPNSPLWIQTSSNWPVILLNTGLNSGDKLAIKLTKLNTASDTAKLEYTYDTTDLNQAISLVHSGGSNLTLLKNGNLGLDVSAPVNTIGLNGNGAGKKIGVERDSTNSNGADLDILAGGGTLGSSNVNGGNLNLSSGISTGNASSNIYFKTATAGTIGTMDNAPSTKMTILGSGNVGVGTSTPVNNLTVSTSSSDLPATTGAASDGGFRLFNGTHTLDMGLVLGGFGAWMQVRNATDYSTKMNLYLNPKGGGVSVGESMAAMVTGSINTANGLLSVNGVNSASSSSYGIMSIGSNYATPSNGNILGEIRYSSQNMVVRDGVILTSVASGAGGANGYGAYFTIKTKGDNAATATERLRIDSSGYVGIGTTAPGYPLQVSGGTAAAPTATYWNWGFGSTSAIASTAMTPAVSIFSTGQILTAGVVINSDERIKKIVSRSDSAKDLEKLLQIQITNYRYIDKLINGGKVSKKVIAQEIEKILPDYVTRRVDFIPNIYRNADRVVHLKNSTVLYLDKIEDLKVGDKLKIYSDKNEEGQFKILEIDLASVTLEKLDYAKFGEKIFVYGKEVDDFRAVDYEAIAMLNVSATQELSKKMNREVKENLKMMKVMQTSIEVHDRKIASLENENKFLKEESKELREKSKKLQDENKEIRDRLSRLEKILLNQK